MNDFELPSNIRQIGTIGGGMRIYVEDYVHTYLHQYAENAEPDETLAFLIGKHLIIDGITYLFINGALQGKYAEYRDGIEMFTKKSFQYADEQIKRYFSGFEIVGWMQSQPGYGTHLNPFYQEYHMETFTKKSDVLLCLDPSERAAAFYLWNDDKSALREHSGYFVYYDKNEGMNEYMLENKVSGAVKPVLSAPTPTPSAPKVTTIRTERAHPRLAPTPEPPPSKPREYRMNLKGGGSGGGTPLPERRVLNMVMGFCCVLFVICFIMGAGLIQNLDRITKMEDNIAVITTAYNYLSSQLKQVASQPVFANIEASNNATPTNTPAATDPVEIDQASPSASATATASPTPTTAPTPTSTPSTSFNTTILEDVPETYTVQQGDNLNYISLLFYGTTDKVKEIMTLNELSDANMIYYGKVLKLPRR